MQKPDRVAPFDLITPDAPIRVETHGERAKCLQRLIRLDLPVPATVALPFSTVRAVAAGRMPDLRALLDLIGPDPVVSVRPSSENPDWGGPSALLDIGMCDARRDAIARQIGREAADRVYLRCIQGYSEHVARLDPAEAEAAPTVEAALEAYLAETEEPFPQDPARQLAAVLRSMARAWEGTSARLLRQGRGAPADAGLGLVVQRMALGVGRGVSGSGMIQFVDGRSGLPHVGGRFTDRSLDRDVQRGVAPMVLTRDAGAPSLEADAPDVFAALEGHGATCRHALREEMQIKFALEDGRISIVDAVRVPRSSRGAVRMAVSLAESDVISREEAVLRIAPRELSELLHRQVDPESTRDVVARGIGASPGAATGRIVFGSAAAQASAARGEACILVRRETSPEDIRGMHSAVGILTERGGMTSHAAVIARGLGLPCVVGAGGIRLLPRERRLQADDGRVLSEGDVITLDGSRGEALAGEAALLEPAFDDAFRTLMAWADEARDIGVRANADTPAEARMAQTFAAEGIGLCRTEHMFFEEDRLTVMREMIFADRDEDRAAALERLLPMQRADFTELFEIMAGLPVCIRLFDPPLHEFLPTTREGIRDLAEALGLPIPKVMRRIDSLSEFNPMLGMRGVRLGITVPQIYDMQARAIFEATVESARRGDAVVPEIMVPLVSARREVELVKARVDAVAAAVRTETGESFDYRFGAMVETPRAALRAEDIATHLAFLSFGTNDLTQMTYGLSRDDAGRFMGVYVAQGVFPEDPFHRLDVEGVGEILMIGAERGRRGNPDVVLSVCGEHGGDPESIAFCRAAGFDYVSCSPFRVPVARLAAAHLALADNGKSAD
ncbi:putative PEP-binding protein [Roseitranquillus sediminis]|uniref:putative PEP-binding protein n=1 Tax=Roseitranquillus sediminis TaxID=2809051 RepID=UPI001D0CC401|nr:putative PEP-binding protein [Roseitranquillus sediminis]MBM9594675.1 pyruvate, phosphate dikinase [Roseitranquillus sediminis]